jgi:hypothetical protein
MLKIGDKSARPNKISKYDCEAIDGTLKFTQAGVFSIRLQCSKNGPNMAIRMITVGVLAS